MKGYTIQHSIELLEKQAGSGSGGASTAADVSYDNTTSHLTADDVQEAIDELNADISRVNTKEIRLGTAVIDSSVSDFSGVGDTYTLETGGFCEINVAAVATRAFIFDCDCSTGFHIRGEGTTGNQQFVHFIANPGDVLTVTYSDNAVVTKITQIPLELTQPLTGTRTRKKK